DAGGRAGARSTRRVTEHPRTAAPDRAGRPRLPGPTPHRPTRMVSGVRRGRRPAPRSAGAPVMKEACHLFLLALMLWPGRAHAQPLFRCEYNWTVTTGEHVYGLRQVAQAPGDIRHT